MNRDEMTLFHHDLVDDFRDDLKLRERSAEAVCNSMYRDELGKHAKEIAAGIEQAEHDLTTFEHDFGEPLPVPLRDALTLEISMWTTIKEYAGATDLREYAKLLVDLIKIEESIFGSCLTRHYALIVKRLQGDVARRQP